MTATASFLVATDFSDDAGHAAYRAAALAAEKETQLDLLHVMSRSSLDALREVFRLHPGAETALIEDVRSVLSQFVGNIAEQTGVSANARVAVGHVLDEILAASERADMLILGVR